MTLQNEAAGLAGLGILGCGLQIRGFFSDYPARGQPASRRLIWIATLRRMLALPPCRGRREGTAASMWRASPRHLPSSCTERNRPMSGERRIDAAAQPPSTIASDIVLPPRSSDSRDLLIIGRVS